MKDKRFSCIDKLPITDLQTYWKIYNSINTVFRFIYSEFICVCLYSMPRVITIVITLSWTKQLFFFFFLFSCAQSAFALQNWIIEIKPTPYNASTHTYHRSCYHYSNNNADTETTTGCQLFCKNWCFWKISSYALKCQLYYCKLSKIYFWK